MQSIKVHELAPPTCVLLLSKTCDPFFSSMLLPLCPCPPSISFVSHLFHCTFSPPFNQASYLCTISPPLSSISIKGMLLIDAMVCTLG